MLPQIQRKNFHVFMAPTQRHKCRRIKSTRI